MQYFAYLAVKKKNHIDAIRLSIEFVQLAIIIWGIAGVRLIEITQLDPEAQD